MPYLTTVATGKPSYVPAVTHIHHNFLVSDGDADGAKNAILQLHCHFIPKTIFLPRRARDKHRENSRRDAFWTGGAIDNDDGSSFYDEHHNFAVYGGAKMGNIDGHAKVSHNNVFAFPNVYGKNCFW